MRYALIMLGACIVLLFAIGGMESRRPSWFSERTEQEIAEFQLRRSASIAHRLHREYMLADSLLPRLSDSPGFVIEMTPRAADTPSAVRRFAIRDLAGFDTLKARLGLFIVNPEYGVYTDVRVGMGSDDYHVFWGVDSAGPYCAVAITLQGNAARGPVLSSLSRTLHRDDAGMYMAPRSATGPCRFWGAYGAPGTSIEAWLRRGGAKFASASATVPQKPDTTRKRRLFGKSSMYDYNPDHRIEACLTHEGNECVELFSAPDITPANSFAAIATSQYYSSRVFGRGEDALLSRFEQQFGKERFARFWTSSQPVDQAFEAAFGVSLQSWLHDWTGTYFGRRDPGPRLVPATWLLSLAVIGALVLTSWVLARRRQIA